MLEIVDRMQIAVTDRARAADTFGRLLGTEQTGEVHSSYLNAMRTVLAIGESELELCEPSGPGPTQTHIDRWGEGLMTAGFATSDLQGLSRHLGSQGVTCHPDADQLYIDGTQTAGFPMVISARQMPRARVGPISFLYEATNTLDTDWQIVAARYADMFNLDATRFCKIANERFAYAGTLTLFDPPARLDRIELSQTFADRPQPMRRFVERRGGDSLYMCFVETHDFESLKARLLTAGAKLSTRSQNLTTETDSMWVHPKNLHGLLLGISRTGFAWDWSGHPELIPPLGG